MSNWLQKIRGQTSGPLENKVMGEIQGNRQKQNKSSKIYIQTPCR